jgi:GxxExxY protein
LAHLAARQLDRVMDKEEVARHIHRAQLLTYLKLSGCSIGFLINWKVSRIKDGIQRMIWHE